MKLINKSILAAASTLLLMAGACQSDEPFSTVADTDAPQILDPLFADYVGGQPAVIANIHRDENFKMNLVVTPSSTTQVKWWIDDALLTEGCKLDTTFLAGTYTMKVTAENSAGSTYRMGVIKVSPLPDDPYSEAVGFERITAPGAPATLLGTNLDKVASLRFADGAEMPFTYDSSASCISYTVPETATNGVHRLILTDADGVDYGANTVTVSAGALVIAGAERMTVGENTTLTGINLNTVETLRLGDTPLTVVSKSNTSITVKCPEMEEGSYMLSGVAAAGDVQFIAGNEIVSAMKVEVSANKALWEGHHYVSWDNNDASPNKTFNLLPLSLFESMKPGTTLTFEYSIEPSAAYHKMGLATGWWTDLVPQFEFSTNGSVSIEMTAERLSLIKQQAGFIVIGHGFYIDRVTAK